MGVINQHRKPVGDPDLLNPSLHVGLQQRLPDRRDFHTEMTADGNGAERVIDAELSRHGHFRVKVHQSPDMEIHSQPARRMDQLRTLSAEHTVFSHAVSFQLTGVSLNHLSGMGIITVDDTHLALPEQKALTFHIFLKAVMFAGTDMVRLQIRKNAIVEHKALGTVQL